MRDNRDVLDRLSFALLEKETLLENELREIFADVRKRPERSYWYSKENREPSDIPPVKAPSELEEEKKGSVPQDETEEDSIVQQPVIEPETGTVEKPATDVNPSPGLGGNGPSNGGINGGDIHNPWGGNL